MKLLKDSLPIPTPTYNQGMFNQLIQKLQAILGINIVSRDEAEEREAIEWFLMR